METTLVVLPQEVTVLAEKVASEKREEVNTLLNQLFSGTEKLETTNRCNQRKRSYRYNGYEYG